MRLSEAIRLGALLKPQGFGGFFDGGKTCALGAACDAVGITANGITDPYGKLWAAFPLAYERRWFSCPVAACTCILKEHKVSDVVYHLNDVHRWTREAIADWVAEVESAQGTEVGTTPAAVPVAVESAQAVPAR